MASGPVSPVRTRSPTHSILPCRDETDSSGMQMRFSAVLRPIVTASTNRIFSPIREPVKMVNLTAFGHWFGKLLGVVFGITLGHARLRNFHLAGDLTVSSLFVWACNHFPNAASAPGTKSTTTIKIPHLSCFAVFYFWPNGYPVQQNKNRNFFFCQQFRWHYSTCLEDWCR